MATYTREGRFTPININSDPSATLAYNQQRLALQAKGSAVVKSQYQKLLDLELTHEDNQEKLNSFFKDANDKLNQNVNIGGKRKRKKTSKKNNSKKNNTKRKRTNKSRRYKRR